MRGAWEALGAATTVGQMRESKPITPAAALAAVAALDRAVEADLESGLAAVPGHGIAWLRLASVRQVLGGPSPRAALRC